MKPSPIPRVAWVESAEGDILVLGSVPEGTEPGNVEVHGCNLKKPWRIRVGRVFELLGAAGAQGLVEIPQMPLPKGLLPPWTVYARGDGTADVIPVERPGTVLPMIPEELARALVRAAMGWCYTLRN